MKSTVSVLSRNQYSGPISTSNAFSSLLKLCTASQDVETGKVIHGYVLKRGHFLNTAIVKALANMYAVCGKWSDSHYLLMEASRRDIVMWNILLAAYAGSRNYAQVFSVLNAMRLCDNDPGAKPSGVTFAVILAVCAKLRALELGRSTHGYALKTGLESQTLVGNALVSMYVKCVTNFSDVREMFCSINPKDHVSWNAMIAGVTENQSCTSALVILSQMVSEGCAPNSATIASILSACGALEDMHHGKVIHAYTCRRVALGSDASVCNSLMTFYLRVGYMQGAESLFWRMESRDLISWNTLISGFSANGLLVNALEMFHELLLADMSPDSVTLLSVLSVCAQLCRMEEGKMIHGYFLKNCKLCRDTAIGNALISFYWKCGLSKEASQVFYMIEKDLISWNTMLAAYAESGDRQKLVKLLDCMWRYGIRPDQMTILNIFRGCEIWGVRVVKEAHAYSLRSGLINVTAVGNAVVDMYAKHGTMEGAYRTFKNLVGKNQVTFNTLISGCLKHGCQESAEVVFMSMSDRDLTSWNLMVQLYAQNGLTSQAVSLFHKLQQQGMKPDVMSVISILPACAHQLSLTHLKQLHAYTVRACFDDIFLDAGLLDKYFKCGSIRGACNIFHISSKRDLIIFTAMINGYAMHGMAKEALNVFNSMIMSNIKPDHVVLIAVLSACRHAGLIEEGWNYFNYMWEMYGVMPTMEHYSCMVDLLTRSGHLKEAQEFMINMPVKPTANMWGTLLGACKIYHEVELSSFAANHLFHSVKDDIGNYILLSNIFAADGRWDKVEEVRKLMHMRNLRKPPGCSWIEVDGTRHLFLAEDYSHLQSTSIYNLLKTMVKQVKEPIGLTDF